VDSSQITPFPILYEDEHLIAINKPTGVLSHPNPSGKRARVAFCGKYDLSDRRFDAGSPIWLIHRLDQDTSGVLLATKTKKAAQLYRELFENKEIRKSYCALVKGIPRPPKGVWRDHLVKESLKGAVRSRVIKGKPFNADLEYKVLKEWKVPVPIEHGKIHFFTITDIDFNLISGRTHQIRVQSSSRGHSILGDDLYGDFKFNRIFAKIFNFSRLYLHAVSLTFIHPILLKPLEIKAPKPKDYEEAYCVLEAKKTSKHF
jgi:RluA family pseudouridine synthase